MVTLEEVPDPDDLALGCSVDGATMQAARTSDLIFDVPRLIAEVRGGDGSSAACDLVQRSDSG
jgi:2-keto-4-pentenoate hydratase/2-oxohepta-3-ene-1,7-dioic acid hydratase in catechol pathway